MVGRLLGQELAIANPDRRILESATGNAPTRSSWSTPHMVGMYVYHGISQ